MKTLFVGLILVVLVAALIMSCGNSNLNPVATTEEVCAAPRMGKPRVEEKVVARFEIINPVRETPRTSLVPAIGELCTVDVIINGTIFTSVSSFEGQETVTEEGWYIPLSDFAILPYTFFQVKLELYTISSLSGVKTAISTIDSFFVWNTVVPGKSWMHIFLTKERVAL